MLTNLYRQTLLGVANNRVVKTAAHKQGWKLGVGRFVAGETLDAALPALHDLRGKGFQINLDLLGEFVDSEVGAETMTVSIVSTLEDLAAAGLPVYMSIKPTQLGLGIGYELAYANMKRVLEKAKAVSGHVCMDMENTPYVDSTLKLYKQLRDDGYQNVSTVLQSYLHRSMQDLQDILALEPKPTLRLVKGAYKESPELAFQDTATVEAKLLEMIYLALDAGARINIGTHDERIIQETSAYIRGAKLPKEHYEYQLLFGVKLALQERLNKEGHTVRIYVPYGRDWYGYFSRRLAERPANLLFVLKGLRG